MESAGIDIKDYLRERGEMVSSFLREYFNRTYPTPPPPVISEAMSYSLLAGGKRLRPVLAMASYEACGGRAQDIVSPAAALEVIHTYSLIHDDLPAMDNDDLRRGRPTCHKVYGDAVAILAGDALLTEAFLMVLDAGHRASEAAVVEAIRELAVASGVRGMVGGQVADIISEGQEPEPQMLHYIHRHKTGALITASVRLGGILYGAPADIMSSLTAYGENLGLAFQIVDDVLDVTGDEEVIGKPVGSDQEKKKMTYPALYGIKSSMQRAGEHIAKALEALGPMGGTAEPLRGIARYVLGRNS